MRERLFQMQVRVPAALLCAAAILSYGCREVRHDFREMPEECEELAILRQVHGTHCHETRPMQLVIRDAAALAQAPIVDVEVDFSREMLLIVTLGRVYSDQYAVRIDRVWRSGPRLEVATTIQTPAPGAPTRMASPYCIAVVPRCALNVAGFDASPPTRIRSWQQSPRPDRW
ncbi:MAG: hypothetical protein ABII12_08090 [Planctomycetota bacterium]